MFVRQRRTVVAACAAMAGIALGAPAGAQAITSGDAYATQDANACSWTLGTAGIEKVVALTSGEFEMTSLKNKVASPTEELVQGTAASDEFRFEWDGATLRGSTGGWSCGSGAARTVTVGGETAIEVAVELTRTGVSVTKRYHVFPSTSLIREQVTYRNTSASARTLARPSFLHQRVLGDDSAANDVDLTFMTGANARHADHSSWTNRTAPLTSTYRRDFDSYDQLACGSNALTLTCPGQDRYQETSSVYVPWFDFRNSAREDGISFGLDLHGRWKAAVGSVDGAPGGLSVTLPNYDASLAPGESVDSPRAWMLTYAGDHDEMTNRLLAWQYRYLWDYARADYFAGVRMLGWWRAGGSGWYGTGGGYDPTGLLQKVFGLADHMRHVGADGYHRDYGWWDHIGTWNGPDWRQTHDYLAKSGIRQTLYQPTYNTQVGATAYNVNPAWWQQGVPCSENDIFGFRLIDLSIPLAADWLQRTLIGNAQKWGDHAWRNDICPIGNVNGAVQLKQSEALVRASLAFLDARPDSSIQSVNSGGTEFGWELLRRSSSASFTDDRGDSALYDASRLFPVDKISGMPDDWVPDQCSAAYNFSLAFTPDYTGTTSDPAKLECLREVVERYRYLKANGVAGRWIRYYHPSATGVQRAWLQRVSRDGTKSVLLLGRDQTGAVTVHPKGLNPGDSYTVSFQLGTGTAGTRTGADLMSRGIALTSPPTGELIWLGLPKRPGAGGDRTAPSAPASVTARYETNMSYPGVGLNWPASSDDHFLSGYDVLRDGARIAVVSKGTYYFDHSPAASTQSTYAVRAFDADGNRSATISTTPTATDATVLDGSAGALGYSGSWSHQTGRVEAYGGTLSVSSTGGDTVSHVFEGSGVTWYAKLGPGAGRAAVTIDGRERTVVDLFAPDETNWRIPVFSRTWNSTARHRVEIAVLPDRNTRSTGTAVNVDGLRIRTTRPTVTEDDAFTYGGTGWKRPSAQVEASDQSITSTASSVSQQHDFSICRTACGGFSGTQGGSDWRYQDLRGGVWTEIATYTARDPTYGRIWHDTTPSVGGWVFPQAIHPGESIDTARTWTAPRSGTIDIASRPAKDVSGGDGVVVKITKNGTTIAGPRTIAATDKLGAAMDVSAVTVAAGDEIRFEINRIGTYNSDRTNWDPEILYRRAGSGCALACQLFSTQQGAGGWRYQGESGGSWSDLSQYGSASADGPGWSDGAGSGPRLVLRDAIRPGAAGAAARTWTAPRAGVVDLGGVPAKLDTAGDGVVVRVTKNGTVVAGPRTIAAGDTTGSAFGATGVTVAAGDLIRFEIAAGATWAGDLTRWDPSVRYQGACQLACQLFGDVQGEGNWRYQDRRNGSWTDIASFLPTGFPTGPTWHDATPSIGGWVFESVQHPGQSLDTARTWIAPVTGTVDIASRPFKLDVNPAGDGVVVRVTKNGRTVLGPRTVAATDGVGSAFDLRGLAVSGGDAIRFEINRNGTYTADQTSWDPQIDYTATGRAAAPAYDPITTSTPSGPLTAEATVTGRTIELVGRRCDACGIVDVWVDGVFADRVDTFGFRGPNTWQALLWKRSWATSAARTIRVVVTGAKSQDARGAAVFLDSIQAAG